MTRPSAEPPAARRQWASRAHVSRLLKSIGPATRRAALAAAFLATAGSGFLHAQTLRVAPTTLVVDTSFKFRGTVEIFVDNVPAPGLRSFQITLDSFHMGEGQPCIRWHSREVDPGLKALWGGTGVDSVALQENGSIVIWRVIGFANSPGASGSFRLGSITYQAEAPSAACPTGYEDLFVWNSLATRYGTGTSANTEFDRLVGGSWVLGRLLDVDMVVSCNQTSPATGFFVDGDTIALTCQVSNLGSEIALAAPTLQVVLSTDATVSEDDIRVGQPTDVIFQPGTGTYPPVSISDVPILTVPQTLNLCAKIDVYRSDLDHTRGRIAETDETNNQDCRPLTVLEPRRDLVVLPSSISLVPDPVDPGSFRAGLRLQVSYDLLNQGSGAVRSPNVRTRIYVGPSLPAIQASAGSGSPYAACSKLQGFGGSSFLNGGSSIHHSYGFGPSAADTCKIPFLLAPGANVLAVQVDADASVLERDPNGVMAPAEANNWTSVPITVGEPLPPQFRVYDLASVVSDTRVDVLGPGSAKAAIGVTSARSLTAYGFTLSWDPPGFISIGDPNVPSGNPGEVTFTGFLEGGGRQQSCAVLSIDPPGGRLQVACTTTDPNGNGTAVPSEDNGQLLAVNFTAAFPGLGTFTFSDLSAEDAAGTPYTGLRSAAGTFLVGGTADLLISRGVPPAEAYPGAPFTTEFDIENRGFGVAVPPIEGLVAVSRDAVNDAGTPGSPDLITCRSHESNPIPGRTSRTRELSTCRLLGDFRPGTYNTFYELDPLLDPSRRKIEPILLPARIVALRDTNSGRAVETFATPGQPGGSSGDRLTRGGFVGRSLAALRSVPRDRNWIVGLRRTRHGRGRLQIRNLPLEPGGRIEVLRDVRVPPSDRDILGAADIDGDGNDELVMSHSMGGSGTALQFRRVDFQLDFPEICGAAATTGPLASKALSAAGIQFDADPEDEVALLASDGSLSIYDVAVTGTLPPASPCRGIPTLIEPPAEAQLQLVASDPLFGSTGGRPLSLCALDWGLDGVEELAVLRRLGSGRQGLDILEAPSGIGGSAVLLADDPAFGKVKGRSKALAIACTR